MTNTIYADLHIHTNFSDGTYSPLKVLKKARKKNLSAISITDHDTFDGVFDAQAHAKDLGIELIPGIEISTFKDDTEIHILGYYKEISTDADITKIITQMQEARFLRAKAMIKLLKEHGIDITIEDVLKQAQHGNISRLHIAQAMLKKKCVKTFREVFEDYIGFSCPCFLPRDKLDAAAVISIIKDSGGIPILAHPGLLKNAQEILPELVKLGIRGLEVFYPLHSKKQIIEFREFAEKNDLIITGGSDCHGAAKAREYIGTIKLEQKYVDQLKASFT